MPLTSCLPLPLRCGVALVVAMLAAHGTPAAETDPLAWARSGAAAYARACATTTGARQSEQWSAASELLWSVHPDAALRAAARQCQQRMDGRQVVSAATADVPGVAALQAEIADLGREFERRLIDQPPRLEFDAAQIKGFPEGWREQFRIGRTERFAFGVGLSEYYGFMATVQDAESRRRMYFAHANRGGLANVRSFDRIVELRRQVAQLQGHASHLDALAARRLAPPPAAVRRFLDDVEAIVGPASAADVAELRRAAGPAAPLHRWDVSVWLERARERIVGQGDTEDASRIPTSALEGWLHAFFGPLAGVRFGPPQPSPWHVAASCRDVQAQDDGRDLGRLCLDLLPRSGKYYNYATYVVPGGLGARRTAVLLANLQPRSLSPDEVERLFGEFAVGLAALTCRLPSCERGIDASFARWSAVQRQLFRQLAFSDGALGVLRSIAPAAAPSRVQAAAIQDNRDFAAGLGRMRELQFARFDHELAASTTPVSVLARWIDTEQRTALPHEPGTYFPSRLNFLVGDGAGLLFHGLWAEAAALAIAEDFAEQPLAPSRSAALRRAFFELESEGTPEQRYAALAGRPFSLGAFERTIRRNTIAAVAARRSTAQARP